MLYQIEVTTHCNFQCFYCAGRDMPQRHMEWTLFERIVAGIPAGDHMVSLQGEGEPTAHPRFWDMVDAVWARGLTPFTITNGSLVDVERFAAKLPRVGISIDTLDAAEAERIGRYKLHRVLANVDALTTRMGPQRIRIMTVDYGQPLDAVRDFVRTHGFLHTVQPLQPKADYARRYPEQLAALPGPAPQRYTYRCRYLERPLRRYYDIEGREYPCCYIKDARNHEPIEIMRAKMAEEHVPAACVGCREILRPENDVSPQTAMSEITFITTCKSRLDFLRRSLPLMAAQPGAEVVVVDYDCPEGTAKWVNEHFPQVRLVSVRNAPVFNVSRARNLGAQAAAGRWLCFIDADVLLDGQFVQRALPALRNGGFYVLTKERSPAQGSVLCLREDCMIIGGYDETLEGYGMEDFDFYVRLEALGRQRRVLPTHGVKVIDHGSDLRTRCYEIKDRWLNRQINALYVQIKSDLARQIGVLNLAPTLKQHVYDEVRRTFLRVSVAGNAPVRVEVTLPSNLVVSFRDWRLQRTWVYTLYPPASGRAAGKMDIVLNGGAS